MSQSRDIFAIMSRPHNYQNFPLWKNVLTMSLTAEIFTFVTTSHTNNYQNFHLGRFCGKTCTNHVFNSRKMKILKMTADGLVWTKMPLRIIDIIMIMLHDCDTITSMLHDCDMSPPTKPCNQRYMQEIDCCPHTTAQSITTDIHKAQKRKV